MGDSLCEEYLSLTILCPAGAEWQQNADVAEYPEVFRHIGLLLNEPLGKAELLFIESSDFKFK